EARAERRPQMPAIENEKLADRVSRSYDWLNKSASERRLESDAADSVADLKATAEKYGLTVEQAELIKNGELLKQSSEFGPAAEHLKSAFRDSPVAESAKWFADVKRSADQDLPGTVAWMAQQYGVHPMQLAQAIAQRFANQ